MNAREKLESRLGTYWANAIADYATEVLNERNAACQTQQQTQSPPLSTGLGFSSSSDCSPTPSFAPAPATSHGAEWEPTVEQIREVEIESLRFNTYVERIRFAVKAGHRIAMEKCKCSQFG